MKPSNTVVVSSEYIRNVEKLKTQLAEANEVMIKCREMLEEESESTTVIEDKVWIALENHLAKWGVK